MKKQERTAKAWIVIVENHEIIEADGRHVMKHFARADSITGGQNIAKIWPENVDTALLVTTKAEAEATADDWNDGYKKAGIYLFDDLNQWNSPENQAAAKDRTGVYIQGLELTLQELEAYTDTLRGRLERRASRGLDDTPTSQAIRKHIKEYEEILRRGGAEK